MLSTLLGLSFCLLERKAPATWQICRYASLTIHSSSVSFSVAAQDSEDLISNMRSLVFALALGVLRSCRALLSEPTHTRKYFYVGGKYISNGSGQHFF